MSDLNPRFLLTASMYENPPWPDWLRRSDGTPILLRDGKSWVIPTSVSASGNPIVVQPDFYIEETKDGLLDIVRKAPSKKSPEEHDPRKYHPVRRPEHYDLGKFQVIDVIESAGLGYHLGNVIKYVLRAGKKGNLIQDLEKAQWYLERAIWLFKQEESDG